MEIRQYSKLTWGANQNILSKLMTGIINPMILYAVPIWVDATRYKWCTNRLRSTQRLMLTTTIRSFRTISAKAAIIISNSLPLEMRAQKLAAEFWIKKKRDLHTNNSYVIPKLLTAFGINPKEDDQKEARSKLEKRITQLWDMKCGEMADNHITKRFLPTPESPKQLKNIKLHHTLVQILTGHSKLNSFFIQNQGHTSSTL